VKETQQSDSVLVGLSSSSPGQAGEMVVVPGKPSHSGLLLGSLELNADTMEDPGSVVSQAFLAFQALNPLGLLLARLNGLDDFRGTDPGYPPSPSDSMHGPLVEVLHVALHPFSDPLLLSFAHLFLDALESGVSLLFEASCTSSAPLASDALVGNFLGLLFVELRLETLDVVLNHLLYKIQGTSASLLTLVLLGNAGCSTASYSFSMLLDALDVPVARLPSLLTDLFFGALLHGINHSLFALKGLHVFRDDFLSHLEGGFSNLLALAV